MNKLFPNLKQTEDELQWRERLQLQFPTGANQRRINYLRNRFTMLKEKTK